MTDMELSKDMRDAIKPALIGVAIGAIGLAIIGFKWGGWTTGGSAEQMASKRAESAVVMALAPICVHNFRLQADAGTQLESLLKLANYDRRTFVEKGGWATPIDAKDPNSAVASACADALGKLTAADLS
jgi:hypothetical protein